MTTLTTAELQGSQSVSQEVADRYIHQAGFADLVEDYEMNECGHVYTLVGGSQVVVNDHELLYGFPDDHGLAIESRYPFFLFDLHCAGGASF